MQSLFAEMIPLGVAAAVSPTMLAGALVLLSGKDRPKARTLSYLVGVVISLVVTGAVLLAIGGAASKAPHGPSPVSSWIDLGLGLLLLYIGVDRFIRGPRKSNDKTAQEEPAKPTSVLKDAGLGLAIMTTNFTSLVFYFAAAKESADAAVDWVVRVMALAIVAFFITLPVLVPLLLTIVMPKTSSRVLDSVDEGLKKYGAFIMPGIALVFGVYLAYKGLRVLV